MCEPITRCGTGVRISTETPGFLEFIRTSRISKWTQRLIELCRVQYPLTLLLFDMVTPTDNRPARRCVLMKSVQRKVFNTVEGSARFGDNASYLRCDE